MSWLERLDADNDNLRTALAWAGEGGEPGIGLRIGAALWRFWQVRGHLTEGREHLERLLASRAGSRAVRAAAELSTARMAFMLGDYQAMRRFIAASMPVHEELGDEWGVSFSLMMLGAAAEAQGDHEQAADLLQEALARARGRVAWVEAATLLFLSQVLEASRGLTEARRVLEEGLRGVRAIGDLRLIAVCLMRLGFVALAQRDFAQARRRLDESLALQREVGDTWGIARSITGLGLVAQQVGDHGAARQLLKESLTVERDADDRAGMAGTLESLASVSASERRPARAARLYASAGVLREAVGDWPLNVAPPEQERLGALRAALGEEAFAEAWAQGRAMSLDETVSYALEEEADLEVARAARGDA